MKYRKLDKNGDRVFGSSSFDFTEGEEAIGLAILTRLKLLKGEWWEAYDDGLPFFQNLAGSKNTEKIKSIIRQRIAETEGVLDVENIEFTQNENRQININFSIKTETGKQSAGSFLL